MVQRLHERLQRASEVLADMAQMCADDERGWASEVLRLRAGIKQAPCLEACAEYWDEGCKTAHEAGRCWKAALLRQPE